MTLLLPDVSGVDPVPGPTSERGRPVRPLHAARDDAPPGGAPAGAPAAPAAAAAPDEARAPGAGPGGRAGLAAVRQVAHQRLSRLAEVWKELWLCTLAIIL